eukprot:TRINITY_DN16520_c0_g1_i1.p1 TRINITY_DN16520_c0_g1~~TRINITY_DN16520_c0_g1_i1.p1  ORF type:complete len:476 (+),score=126.71 TRINITY_DN16520_c0_g1_i1:90-1517(+)
MDGTRASSDPTETAGELRIVSWNVAGWETALALIRKYHTSLDAWLDRHGIDILCLQETKTVKQVLEQEGKKRLATHVAGWETLWCCNEGKAAQRKGLNGVATYARVGLTRRANAAPLGDAELDGEGRCLLTDHGAFVIINVYLPYTGPQAADARVVFKVKYMEALAVLIKQQQEAGKGVFLVGDMNVAPRGIDRHWKFRHIPVLSHFPDLLPESSPVLQEVAVAALNGDGAARLVRKRGRVVSYDGYYDFVRRHLPADMLAQWEAVAEEEGESTTPPCILDAYRRLVDRCNLKDAVWGGAEGPWYSCWDQQRNKRYANEGSRIDHVLADAALWGVHGLPGAFPSEGTPLEWVTGFGEFHPAPMSGGGLPEPFNPASAFDRQFAAGRECPLLFTPPHYSDHIGVAVRLRRTAIPAPLVLEKGNKAVKECQPHAQQRSIASFFAKKPAAKTEGGKRPPPSDTAPAAKRAKKDSSASA